jgi:hypothetical protein
MLCLDGQPRFAADCRANSKIILRETRVSSCLNKDNMSVTIKVDRQRLYYRAGTHCLTLGVEWSGVSKTEDCPIDFEVSAFNLEKWDDGESICSARREQLLDEIASYYAQGPVADIIGKDGEMLRGASKFRFSLQIPPTPSRYFEVGRSLLIPMVPTHGVKEWNKKYILDFNDINEWSTPKTPLAPEYLKVIAERIVRTHQIGIIGLSTTGG